MPEARRDRPTISPHRPPAAPLLDETASSRDLPAPVPAAAPPAKGGASERAAAASVRVSDADRESTVDRLRQASTEGLLDLDEYADRVGRAYEARSRADLDRVVDDLPVPAFPAPVGVARGVRWTVAVFSSHKRNGPWRPAPETRVLAVLGSCRIDLTDIDPADLGDELEIRAIAVLGGIEVLVPGGVAVELGGFAFVGSRDYRVRRTSPVGDRPVVRVRANAWFGGVTVRSRPDPVP